LKLYQPLYSTLLSHFPPQTTPECASYTPQHRTSVTDPGSSHEATLLCIVSCRSVGRLSSPTVQSSAVIICKVKDFSVLLLTLKVPILLLSHSPQDSLWHYRFLSLFWPAILTTARCCKFHHCKLSKHPQVSRALHMAITSSF
jgi:hypothetical protein